MAKHSRALAAWRQYRMYRLSFVALVTIWLLLVWSTRDINSNSLDTQYAVLFLLDVFVFGFGLLGFYLVIRRGFPVHLAFFGVCFPLYHILLMKSDVIPAFLVSLAAFGDFYFNALLPPGSLQKLMWAIWVQGRDELADS